MAVNEIKIASDSFLDENIVSANMFMVQSLNGNDLQYDTLNATLELSSIIGTKFIPKGSTGMLTSDKRLLRVLPLAKIIIADPSKYKYGAEVLFYHDHQLIGKFYMISIQKKNTTQFEISCASGIGLLTNVRHYGGIYTGATFESVVKDIMGDILPFTIAEEIKNIPIYGWLPVASRRDNLQKLLFATGTIPVRDTDGRYKFTYIGRDEASTVAVGKVIPDNSIFTNGKIVYPEEISGIIVTEHNYAPIDETEEVYKGTVEAENIITPKGKSVFGSIVMFDAPHRDYTAVGCAILEQGTNYVVLGNSAGAVVTAKKYNHSTRELKRLLDKKQTNKENFISIHDQTLVSLANIESIAERLNDYYTSARRIKNAIAMSDERPGDRVGFKDPEMVNAVGIVNSMNINASSILKADTEIITGYVPEKPGNFYKNIEIISTNRSWKVPSGITRIRVVLIGGGQGGTNGTDGKPGTAWEGDRHTGDGTDGVGGDGGKAGKSGIGGNVLIKTLEVSPGQSFSATVGSGGTAGAVGGNSTFGSLSSASGSVSPYGYTDLFNNITYATSGKPGFDGGKGGDPGQQGEGVNGFVGGSPNPRWGYGVGPDERTRYNGGPNGGGGASASSNGENGQIGRRTSKYGGTIGGGGNGADATTPPQTLTYGSGGNAGNGGGGGGGATLYVYNNVNFDEVDYGTQGIGLGGKGSPGGNGKQGCVLVYY